jgi:hypothetical protein
LKLAQMLGQFGISVNQIKNNVHLQQEQLGQIFRIAELFRSAGQIV